MNTWRRVSGPSSKDNALVEKEMFGGLAYLSHGKMFAGILQNDLVVRVGPDGHNAALKEPHTRPMDFTGRPIRRFVFVEPGGYRTEKDLRKWVQRTVDFVSSLPAK